MLELMRQKMNRLLSYRMPFGKYKNMKLVDLPEPYVVWFSQKGFPEGELGEMLAIVYEIKLNGLEYLFKESDGPRSPQSKLESPGSLAVDPGQGAAALKPR